MSNKDPIADVITADEVLAAIMSLANEGRQSTSIAQVAWRIERMRGRQPAPSGRAVADALLNVVMAAVRAETGKEDT